MNPINHLPASKMIFDFGRMNALIFTWIIYLLNVLEAVRHLSLILILNIASIIIYFREIDLSWQYSFLRCQIHIKALPVFTSTSSNCVFIDKDFLQQCWCIDIACLNTHAHCFVVHLIMLSFCLSSVLSIQLYY